jgi:hypothetical protein
LLPLVLGLVSSTSAPHEGAVGGGSGGAAAAAAVAPPPALATPPIARAVFPTPTHRELATAAPWRVAEDLTASPAAGLASALLVLLDAWARATLAAKLAAAAHAAPGPSLRSTAARVAAGVAEAFARAAAARRTTPLGLVAALRDELVPRLACCLLEPAPLETFAAAAREWDGAGHAQSAAAAAAGTAGTAGAATAAPHAPLLDDFLAAVCQREASAAAFCGALLPEIVPALCTLEPAAADDRLALLGW